MRTWHAYSADERFDLWLAEWEQFRQEHSISGHLAVLDTLAGLIPDGPLTLLDELELWSGECDLTSAWRQLRWRFEADLWSQLHHLRPSYEELAPWYSQLFYILPLPYRRAAFLVAFLDFLLIHLHVPLEDFQPLREWLIAVARWSHSVDVLKLGSTMELPARHPLRKVTMHLPPRPTTPR
jgi:hypothetical protein